MKSMEVQILSYFLGFIYINWHEFAIFLIIFIYSYMKQNTKTQAFILAMLFLILGVNCQSTQLIKQFRVNFPGDTYLVSNLK